MANPEHLEMLKRGGKEWDQWRESHPDVEPDLSGADLSGAKLIGAKLNWAKLSRADYDAPQISDH